MNLKELLLVLLVVAAVSLVTMWWLISCSAPRRRQYRTLDGGKPCPHPGMTDADLDDYNRLFR